MISLFDLSDTDVVDKVVYKLSDKLYDLSDKKQTDMWGKYQIKIEDSINKCTLQGGILNV